MARRNKYNAKATVVDGIRFDSKGEAHHWCKLRMMEKSGLIRKLERQVRFPIVVDGQKVGRRAYVADFSYYTDKGRVVENFKGFDTDMSKFKRELVKAIYSVDVQIVRAS